MIFCAGRNVFWNATELRNRYLLQCVKENRLCNPAENHPSKDWWVFMWKAYEWTWWEAESAGTLWGTSNQLGENTGKKRNTQATPAFSGSKFANANRGVTTILQSLQTKFRKTWNFSLSKMLIEQICNNLLCLNISKYLHCTHLRKVTFLWNLLWKYFHEQC